MPACENFENELLFIQAIKKHINDLIIKKSLEGKTVTIVDLKKCLCPIESNITFNQFVQKKIAEKMPLAGKALCYKWQNTLNKINLLNKHIHFENINVSLLEKFELQLRSIHKNNDITTHKNMNFFRQFINWAIEGEYMVDSPFKKYKMPGYKVKREILSETDVRKLLQSLQYISYTETQKEVLQYFLFSCFTGLRYSDVQGLKNTDIENNIIYLKMKKTSDTVRIPLNNVAQQLISEKRESHFFFKTITNQKTNYLLKIIAKKNNIQKRLTFHMARHTFATLGLSKGIPIQVMQQLLGHTKIETTLVYTHIVDEEKKREIEKLNIF